MNIRRFKNGNIHIRLDDYEDCSEFGLYELLAKFYNALGDWCDCSLLGEEYCLGNAIGMCQDLYDWHTGKVLSFPYGYVPALKEHKTCVLVARTPNENDKENLEQFLGQSV